MIKAFIIFAALLSGEAKDVKVNTEASTISWKGSKIVGNSHTGTIALKSGVLDVAKGKLKGGSFSIDMTTLNSGDSDRLVGHLKSDDFFGVEAFPTADMIITNVSAGKDGAYQVTGDFTIKGKTESITFPATLKETDNGYEASASITVDRSKFEVRYGSNSFFDNLGDKAIDNNFTLEVMLVADK